MMMTRKAPADPTSALGVAQPAFCSRRRRLRVLHLREYTSVKSMRDLSCRVVLPSDVEPHIFIQLSYVQAAIMPALLPALPSRPLLFAAVSAYWTSRTIVWSERGGHPESGKDPLRASLHCCVLLLSFHHLLNRHPTSAVGHDSVSCSGVVIWIEHVGASTVVLMLIPVVYLLSVCHGSQTRGSAGFSEPVRPLNATTPPVRRGFTIGQIPSLLSTGLNDCHTCRDCGSIPVVSLACLSRCLTGIRRAPDASRRWARLKARQVGHQTSELNSTLPLSHSPLFSKFYPSFHHALRHLHPVCPRRRRLGLCRRGSR
jgi:hypothetical protein